MAPKINPLKMTMTTEPNIPSPLLIAKPNITPAKLSIEPTDMSIPPFPAKIINASPKVNKANGAPNWVISKRFSKLRK